MICQQWFLSCPWYRGWMTPLNYVATRVTSIWVVCFVRQSRGINTVPSDSQCDHVPYTFSVLIRMWLYPVSARQKNAQNNLFLLNSSLIMNPHSILGLWGKEENNGKRNAWGTMTKLSSCFASQILKAKVNQHENSHQLLPLPTQSGQGKGSLLTKEEKVLGKGTIKRKGRPIQPMKGWREKDVEREGIGTLE